MAADRDDARLISVGRVSPTGGWHMGPAAHRNCELIIVIRGMIRVVLSGTEYQGTAGDVLFYPAGAVHEEWSDREDPVETLFLVFDLSQIDPSHPSITHDSEGRLRQTARWLHAEWPDHAIGTARLCEGFFRTILLEWERLHRGGEPAFVADTRRLIRERIDSAIDLEMLARAHDLSRYHFIRKYKSLCGRTPMADVRAERVRHAQHLIVTTDLPLKDVASRAGMSDEYHLGHLIRRYLNVTPGELRRSVR